MKRKHQRIINIIVTIIFIALMLACSYCFYITFLMLVG